MIEWLWRHWLMHVRVYDDDDDDDDDEVGEEGHKASSLATHQQQIATYIEIPMVKSVKSYILGSRLDSTRLDSISTVLIYTRRPSCVCVCVSACVCVCVHSVYFPRNICHHLLVVAGALRCFDWFITAGSWHSRAKAKGFLSIFLSRPIRQQTEWICFYTASAAFARGFSYFSSFVVGFVGAQR